MTLLSKFSTVSNEGPSLDSYGRIAERSSRKRVPGCQRDRRPSRRSALRSSVAAAVGEAAAVSPPPDEPGRLVVLRRRRSVDGAVRVVVQLQVGRDGGRQLGGAAPQRGDAVAAPHLLLAVARACAARAWVGAGRPRRPPRGPPLTWGRGRRVVVRAVPHVRRRGRALQRPPALLPAADVVAVRHHRVSCSQTIL